jgi:hypothetical protein
MKPGVTQTSDSTDSPNGWTTQRDLTGEFGATQRTIQNDLNKRLAKYQEALRIPIFQHYFSNLYFPLNIR